MRTHSLQKLRLTLALTPLAFISLGCDRTAGQQSALEAAVTPVEPKEAAQIRKITKGDYELRVFDNSTLLSQTIAINSKGDLLGSRELTNNDATVYFTRYFFCSGEKSVNLQVPEGYTNLVPEEVSDSGLIVGYVSRAIGSGPASLAAAVWDGNDGTGKVLPMVKGDTACHAQCVSADGTRITGYTTGAEPPRLRPCLWEKDSESGEWKPQVLETILENNPYTMSSGVLISPDGKIIVSCCTFQILDGFVDSSLFAWTQDDAGRWQRELVSDEQFYLRDVNNSGVVVGSIAANGVRIPVRVDLQGDISAIELLPGDESGEALAVNNLGQIVGVSNDPHGPEGGPQPFIWESGETRQIDFGDTPFATADAINDAGQIAGMIDISFTPEANREQAEASPREIVEKSLAYVSQAVKK